jgi:hypothetical protein
MVFFDLFKIVGDEGVFWKAKEEVERVKGDAHDLSELILMSKVAEDECEMFLSCMVSVFQCPSPPPWSMRPYMIAREVLLLRPILERMGPMKEASSVAHCVGVKLVSGYRSIGLIIVTYLK